MLRKNSKWDRMGKMDQKLEREGRFGEKGDRQLGFYFKEGSESKTSNHDDSRMCSDPMYRNDVTMRDGEQ